MWKIDKMLGKEIVFGALWKGDMLLVNTVTEIRWLSWEPCKLIQYKNMYVTMNFSMILSWVTFLTINWDELRTIIYELTTFHLQSTPSVSAVSNGKRLNTPTLGCLCRVSESVSWICRVIECPDPLSHCVFVWFAWVCWWRRRGPLSPHSKSLADLTPASEAHATSSLPLLLHGFKWNK